MKRLIACAMALLAAGIAPTTAAAADTTDAKRGRAIAERHCAACHAIGPNDTSPHRITPPFRDLHARYPIAMLEQARRTGVVTGHDEMPMFELSLPDAASLLSYIDSLQPPGGPTYVGPARAQR